MVGNTLIQQNARAARDNEVYWQMNRHKNKKLNKENYQAHTDKYFLRSKEILDSELVNPIVRYQVFARQDLPALKGVDESIDFIRDVVGDKVKIYSLKEGQAYIAGEPLMKLEGHVQDLVDLETGYLEILSGNLTGEIDLDDVRKKARAVVQAAAGKPVFYFGARHFHYNLDEKIAKICQEEGFQACSTDIGAKAWNAEGIGTTPHALILAYAAHLHENKREGNPTIEAAKSFDAFMSCKIPRVMLIDTFNKEIDDTIATKEAVPNLAGVRIDTCGENYAQGSKNIALPDINVDEKYLRGKGVKIAGIWALRRALDAKGYNDLEITVSSGFNEDKTGAFIEADRVYQGLYEKPLFDSIGTGSLAKPIMTTSDIVAYFNKEQKEWIPMSKKGRGEILTDRLEEVKK